MISSKNIRFHTPSNTYIIPKNSVVDQNITVKGNVIAGSGVRFWKNVKIDGNIQLGKSCIVEGNLKANKIIIGSHSKVKGNIEADTEVSLFQNAIVNSIESSGGITIMQGCTVGYANGSTLTVIGKADIRKIGPITKVTVRADTVAEMEEEECEKEFAEEEFIDEKFGAPDVGNESENDESENELDDRANSIKSAVQSEEDNVEMIDEADASSPKSFTVSAFAGAQADHVVSVPADESDEVEIVGETDDSNASEGEMISETIETPFGRIAVGGKPASKGSVKEPLSDEQFASVTEVSKEEQQADYEAEIRTKPKTKSETVFETKPEAKPETKPETKSETRYEARSEMKSGAGNESAPRKSEFRWPAFEPRKMPKNEKQQPHASKKPAAWSSDDFFNQMKASSDQIQFDEIKIQAAPGQKENLFEQRILQNNESAAVSKAANQKITFEEVGYSPATPMNPPQKSKAEILMEQMNFDAALGKSPGIEMKKRPEKRERSREEIERSKIWYEERYPKSESEKKEYSPYM